jgi:hypothetical protein
MRKPEGCAPDRGRCGSHVPKLHTLDIALRLWATPTKKALRREPECLVRNNFNYFAPRIASFAAFATRNFTTRLAGI